MLRDEMTVIMMNGHRVPFTSDKMARLLFHWATLSVWLVLDILALASNLFPPLNAIEGWQALGLLILSNFIGMLAGMLFIKLQVRLMNGRAYATLAIFPAAVIGTTAVVWPAYAFGVQIDDSLLGLVTLYGLVYCCSEIFIAVMVHTLEPRITARTEKTTLADAAVAQEPVPLTETAPETAPETGRKAGPDIIQFASRSVAADSILRIVAQGNYVQIITETETFLEVGPLKAVVVRLPEGLGAIIHRSYWVAWRDVKRIQMEGRSATLELHSGAAIPVSRGKRAVIPADLPRFPV